MPAAFSPDTPETDQTMGAHPSHTAKGSRFNDLNSRNGVTTGATLTEALAQVKSGDFTQDDLRQLAFTMGFQIIEGKDTAALVAEIADLKKQVGELHARATGAEAAFAKTNKSKG